LETSPPESDTHVWADYVEALCIASADRYFTLGDLMSRLKARRDLGEAFERDATEDDAEASGSEEGQADSPAPDRGDEAFVRGLFEHLQYRAASFRSAYPFEINSRRDALRLRSDPTEKQKLYMFFLLSACHERLGSNGPLILKQFERVSREALRRMLPGLEVRLFGSGTTKCDYSGNKWARIRALAADLCVEVKAKEHEFSKHDVGDSGLDLVAYTAFGDGASHLLVVFGQCACTPAWKTKQYSSGFTRWGNILDFNVPPQNMLFIPYCLRESSGRWYEQHEISQTVMIDRVRLVRLLAKGGAVGLSRESGKLVEVTLATHEPVF
jgi:hypothetical protein